MSTGTSAVSFVNNIAGLLGHDACLRQIVVHDDETWEDKPLTIEQLNAAGINSLEQLHVAQMAVEVGSMSFGSWDWDGETMSHRTGTGRLSFQVTDLEAIVEITAGPAPGTTEGRLIVTTHAYFLPNGNYVAWLDWSPDYRELLCGRVDRIGFLPVIDASLNWALQDSGDPILVRQRMAADELRQRMAKVPSSKYWSTLPEAQAEFDRMVELAIEAPYPLMARPAISYTSKSEGATSTSLELAFWTAGADLEWLGE